MSYGVRPPQPLSIEPARTLFVAFASLLLGFGVLMAQSSSITSWPTEFEQIHLSRQLLFIALGVTLAGVAGAIPATVWRAAAPWLFAVSILLLLAVWIPGVGVKVKGAQRWIRLGGFSLQPSEFLKITLPLVLCWLQTRPGYRHLPWTRSSLTILWPAAIAIPLVLIQPDLGTAVFLAAITLMTLVIGGWPLTYVALAGLVSVPVLGVLVLLKPYQAQRIIGFLETWVDWSTAPYQLKQSLVTIGSGGWWGSGIGQGWQKLSFLPEANTDFVFAVIGEELGLVGTLTVVALWAGLYLSGLRLVALCEPQTFRFQLAFVLLTQTVAQAALNVAVVTAMVPPKGISHPLISCGGSNLVVSLLALGCVFGLSGASFTESPGHSSFKEPPAGSTAEAAENGWPRWWSTLRRCWQTGATQPAGRLP